MQQTFFETDETQPLAARLRPTTLDEFAGQKHLLGEGKVLRRLIENDRISSMIFWGPPGVGKTTLARIIAHQTKSAFIDFSAVTSGIKEIRQVMQKAEDNRRFGEKTILFVDEIHRFNKAQQDAFLPFVEKGSILLIGATTENPSFEVNGALLSRCKVFVLQPLSADDLLGLLSRALSDPRGFGHYKVDMPEELLRLVANFANGDARSALSTLEMVVLNSDMEGDTIHVTREGIEQCISQKSLLYDKNGEEHYNLISALHKSMRNSDPDAALYWLARMLEAGEDPLYVARRVTRFASEDIGLADPRALEQAIAAYQACHFLGMPECAVHLSQAVVYLSLAPKSNALYMGYERAKGDAQKELAEPVPLALRNAPTRLMRELDYGKGYQYAHDAADKLTNLQCLPDSLRGKSYYRPTTQGLEARFAARFAEILAWKRAHGAQGVPDWAGEAQAEEKVDARAKSTPARPPEPSQAGGELSASTASTTVPARKAARENGKAAAKGAPAEEGMRKKVASAPAQDKAAPVSATEAQPPATSPDFSRCDPAQETPAQQDASAKEGTGKKAAGKRPARKTAGAPAPSGEKPQ